MNRPLSSLTLALAFGCGIGLPSIAGAQGLAVTDQVRQSWPSRLVAGLDQSASRGAVGSMLNDLWVTDGVALGREGEPVGLRASGGVLLGAGSAALAVAAVAGGSAGRLSPSRLGLMGMPSGPLERSETYQPQPYLGIGYTHRTVDGAWDLAADVGMVAATDTGSSWGRTLLDANRLDEAMRNLRLRPVLQFGARYRF